MLSHTAGNQLVPQLHKPLSDPKDTFMFYDCPASRDVEYAAHVLASNHGYAAAFDRLPLLHGVVKASIPDFPKEFGGHPRTVLKHALPASLARIADGSKPTTKETKPVHIPPPTFRALCGLSPP